MLDMQFVHTIVSVLRDVISILNSVAKKTCGQITCDRSGKYLTSRVGCHALFTNYRLAVLIFKHTMKFYSRMKVVHHSVFLFPAFFLGSVKISKS